MILQSIQLSNFGLYQGDHEIHFQPDADKPVTLIGGLNGRGKTTLLDAITLGLYGRRALKYLQDERIRYGAYLQNHINKNVPYGSTTAITITLAESERAQEVITIRRFWEKPLKGEPEEQLTASRNGLPDEYLSQNWDYFVEEILPLNISRFFFFDNEKIAQIADDETFESVKDSIRSLLGLTTIEQLIADMGKLSKKVSSEKSGGEESKILAEINYLESQIATCERNAKAAYDEAAHYQHLIQKARSQFEEEQEQFWKAGGNLGLERSRLEEDLKKLETQLSEDQSRAVAFAVDSASPLLCCKSLLDQLHLRQSQSQQQRVRRLSANVISDLLDRLTGLSGYSASFAEEAGRFLKEARDSLNLTEEDGEVYTLSDEASQRLNELLASWSFRMQEIRQLLDRMTLTREQSVQIESHLAREVNEQEAQTIWDRMMVLNETINQNEVNKRVVDEKRQRLERELEIYEHRRQKLVAGTLEIRKTQGESERVALYSQMVMETMNDFKERLTVKRVEDLSHRILSCFQSMVGKTSMIHEIQIDPRTLDLKLVDDAGAELLKNQLSAGEKQLFAVSIIWGLAQCSGYEMPVVIDTPLGRLDSKHRTNFVEGYLPHAGKQVVVLSTDEEINGRYLDSIRPFVNAFYTLVYDEEKRASHIQPGYFGGDRP